MTELGAETEEEFPILVAAPGMTYAEVTDGSSADLGDPPLDVRGEWLAQPEGAHRFQLEHPTLGFVLPPGLFSLVEAPSGVVRRLRATPQLGYLDWQGVLDLIESLHEILIAAGWELRSRFEAPRLARTLTERADVRASLFRPLPDIKEVIDPSTYWRLDLVLRRAVDAGSDEARELELEGAGYLLTAQLTDEAQPA